MAVRNVDSQWPACDAQGGEAPACTVRAEGGATSPQAAEKVQPRVLIVAAPDVACDLPRSAGGQFAIETAATGQGALAMMASGAEYAVVVAGYGMPDMDGLEFLSALRAHWPVTVRVLLTGSGDVDVAIAAVNRSHVFRILTRPVECGLLHRAIQECLGRHRRVAAEHKFMEDALGGSLSILSDVLSLVNPSAARRGQRVRDQVRRMARRLGLPRAWRYALAAEFSQLGCIAVASDTVEKACSGEPLGPEEQAAMDAHPGVGSRLIASIPRLDAVAQMVAGQRRTFRASETAEEPRARDPVVVGAQLLRVAHGLDLLIHSGRTREEAVEELRRRPEEYDPAIVAALDGPAPEPEAEEAEGMVVSELAVGMVLAEDVRDIDGLIVVARGQELTPPLVARLRRLERVGWLEGAIPIRTSL